MEMKKVLLSSFLALTLLFSLTPTTHANYFNPNIQSFYPNIGDAIPLEVIKHNNLKVYFAPLVRVENISYVLTYDAEGVPQGVQGSFDPGKKLTVMKTIFLGTCSQGNCVKHQDIENLELEVTFEFKDGSTETKTYEINDPFFL